MPSFQPEKTNGGVSARSYPASTGTEESSALRVGDSMGAFVGYLRRPKSNSAGLVAQFFGENGDDADVIAALHLTRFLDNPVRVTVWMMKDRDGRLMKKNGAYPKITEFVGTIRRPQPNMNGQVAQFFGENGANADAINILNHSRYLDALVYVQMHQAAAGMTAQDLNVEEPDEDMDAQSNRMTPVEARAFKKLQKKAEEAMHLLIASGFFRQESVLAALGRPENFFAWLGQQYCSHPGERPCDRQPVSAWKIPGPQHYQAIALCTHHREAWDEGQACLEGGQSPIAYAQSQAIVAQQRWARGRLNEVLRVPAEHIPTPGAVYSWAVGQHLQGYVPATYKAFLV